MPQYFFFYSGSALAITFYFSVFSFELNTELQSLTYWWWIHLLTNRLFWPTTLSWPILTGSVFTGLAWAASWKKIKASERTTNSSLITPSLTNASGTNYLFIVCKQERASPDSPMSNRGCQMCFSLDGKSQLKTKRSKCNLCSSYVQCLWMVMSKTGTSNPSLQFFGAMSWH